MKILAIEFSSDQRGVAVIDGTADGAPVVLSSQKIAGGSRETPAFALIDRALSQARLEREQINCVAVGLGPGSYTGIRMAISLAQGWQLARNVRLIGLSSIECLAAQAQIEGIFGKLSIVVDAQRNEFYLATYDITAEKLHVLDPPRLASLDEVQLLSQSDGTLIGPEVDHCFPRGKALLPGAATLGKLAAARTDFLSGEKLEPIYLRETKFVKAPPPRVIRTV